MDYYCLLKSWLCFYSLFLSEGDRAAKLSGNKYAARSFSSYPIWTRTHTIGTQIKKKCDDIYVHIQSLLRHPHVRSAQHIITVISINCISFFFLSGSIFAPEGIHSQLGDSSSAIIPSIRYVLQFENHTNSHNH